MSNFPISLWLWGALVIVAAVTLLWIFSVRLKDASIIDVFWGPGFLIVTTFWYAFGGSPVNQLDANIRRHLLLLLVALWSIRLAVHIGRRNLGKGEDRRYKAWRESNGPGWWWLSYPKVYLLQSLLMWVIALPLWAGVAGPAKPFELVSIIGLFLWLVGFLFETIGDWQLTQFRKNPDNKGKLMTQGLWRFTRHPNYFGEATLWFGYWLIALPSGPWWIALSPFLLLFLLLKVSGVSLLEQSMKAEKPGYHDYVRRTSSFFPWIPK